MSGRTMMYEDYKKLCEDGIASFDGETVDGERTAGVVEMLEDGTIKITYSEHPDVNDRWILVQYWDEDNYVSNTFEHR